MFGLVVSENIVELASHPLKGMQTDYRRGRKGLTSLISILGGLRSGYPQLPKDFRRGGEVRQSRVPRKEWVNTWP
jgi:hypothetical protein